MVPSLAIPVVTGGSPARVGVQGLAEARTADDPKVGYLIRELIAQRFEGARLSIELAEARVEAAQAKEIFYGQAELLTVLIAALRVRDRENATLRAETADLRQRLEAAQTELERERAENRRLVAELAAAQAKQPSEMQTAAMGHDHPVEGLAWHVRSVTHNGRNASDDARQQLAERVLNYLQVSGPKIDEADEALGRKPRMPLHRTPAE